MTFFSRTRNQLWTKGETSGNRLKLVSATIDCDCDTLLFEVEVERAGSVSRGHALLLHQGIVSARTKGRTHRDAGGSTMKIRLGIPKGSLRWWHCKL